MIRRHLFGTLAVAALTLVVRAPPAAAKELEAVASFTVLPTWCIKSPATVCM